MKELSAEVSNAYSLTDNLLLFGDYNIDQFNTKEKEIIDNFTSGLELNPRNVDTPTCISKTNQSLIDHCFMTKNQIVEWKVCLPPIEVDHNIIFYQSNLVMIGSNEDTNFFRRNLKFFSGEKFNRDLAFADWQPLYQEENCDEMFTKFNEIFQSILDQHAPIQILDSSLKQNKQNEKPWTSKELKKLIAEKHHLYNQYKFSQNYDVFDEFKKYRNRKLRDAHRKYSVNFFKQYETSKQKWNFINKKLGNHKQGINVSENEID